MGDNTWSWLTCTQKCSLCERCHQVEQPTATVVSKMKEIFAEHGIPDVLWSGNGPQYASAAFQEFTRNWEFQHITLSPCHPASNEFAESMVKIVKTTLPKPSTVAIILNWHSLLYAVLQLMHIYLHQLKYSSSIS